MPTPSGLIISLLPTGTIPLSGQDILLAVQNGNTVQVPASAVVKQNTDQLPEGTTNLYFSPYRVRQSVGAMFNGGITYDSTSGIFSIDQNLVNRIDTTYNKSITGIQLLEEGKQKTIIFQTQDPTYEIPVSWTDLGSEIELNSTYGIDGFYNSDTLTLVNTDKGSDQNIFKNIYVNNSLVFSATGNNDRINFIAGTGLQILSNSGTRSLTIQATGIANPVSDIQGISGVTAERDGDTVTISNSDKGSSQYIFKNIAIDGTSSVVSATGNNSTLYLVPGANIDFSVDENQSKIVINAISNVDVSTGVQSVNNKSGVVLLSSDDISEGTTNLYYTAARVRSSFSAGTGISIVNGEISNTHYPDYFRYIEVSGQSTVQPTGADILKFVAGTGITLISSKSAGSVVYDTITINSTYENPSDYIEADNYQVLYYDPVSKKAKGSSGLTYSPASGLSASGNVTISKTHASPNSYTLQVAGNGSNYDLQKWTVNNTLMSKITSSGSFQGAVTPIITGVGTNIELTDQHNGMIIETYKDLIEDPHFIFLSTGISIPSWNVKIRQGGKSQAVVDFLQDSPLVIQYPSDRYPRTRRQNSVIEVYKNNYGYALYGDLYPTGTTDCSLSGEDPYATGQPPSNGTIPDPVDPPTNTTGCDLNCEPIIEYISEYGPIIGTTELEALYPAVASVTSLYKQFSQFGGWQYTYDLGSYYMDDCFTSIYLSQLHGSVNPTGLLNHYDYNFGTDLPTGPDAKFFTSVDGVYFPSSSLDDRLDGYISIGHKLKITLPCDNPASPTTITVTYYRNEWTGYEYKIVPYNQIQIFSGTTIISPVALVVGILAADTCDGTDIIQFPAPGRYYGEGYIRLQWTGPESAPIRERFYIIGAVAHKTSDKDRICQSKLNNQNPNPPAVSPKIDDPPSLNSY